MFQDRSDAARRLAASLQACAGQKPLVLAIPRGAVPMGRIIAQQLGGELDVVLVRKLHAPFQPELAVGAVDESGWTYTVPQAERVGADAAYLAQETRTQMQALRARRALYRPVRTPIDPAGRTVIVVDDGLATGATMVAALHGLRARHPARLICAVPVASREALALVRPLADEVVCLEVPPDFAAVGQFYRDFAQVEDSEVVRLLAGA
ncbi:phosphoribosyltransferase [Comamonas granuli]|uniref:phosphoribosyltransferase n=1 Tax=Comamonas granuli TaxID=290309 RepID=UPI0005A9A065|nr:phosphoribosyltransferase family protein [Comamonas granuli]